ncbi:MAG: hypothetical protein JW953_13650 [Anaerolineae bacterium]|nr:hypothetical protein [Anaerolineae bacterium]
MRLLATVVILMLISGLIIVGFMQLKGDIKITGRVADFDLVKDASRAFDPIERRPIVFPDDLAAHPNHQTDGWFYSGHLTDEMGHQYGVQLTFIRFGVSRGLRGGISEWTANQIYFASLSVTDETGQTFNYEERFSRGNGRLAGAGSNPYRVWVENWFVQEVSPGNVQLRADNGEIALDLTLQQVKPAVWPDQARANLPGQAIAYYALTNNQAQGIITTPRGAFPVTGQAGHIHAWGNLNFGPIAGWDLFFLQLVDGREIIYLDVHHKEEPFKDPAEPILLVDKLLLVGADGQAQTLSPNTVELTGQYHWESPQSKTEYPIEWSLAIPNQAINLKLKPLLVEQEVNGYLTYWQGVVVIQGSQEGYGYLQMTGQSHW